MNKSKAAFLFASRSLGKDDRLFMWTFTFKDMLNVKDTRKRWNYLLTLLLRAWPMLQGVRVFELHEEHGLHVHLVTNSFIDVNRARLLAEKAGWGRIHVRRIPAERVGYLAKYLSKDRPECLKRWRLWAGFGQSWEWTKVKDVVSDSALSRIYRACKEWQGWTGKGEFFERMALVRKIFIKSIEEGWDIGRGSFGKPYWMCSPEELEWGSLNVEAPF
ncbi:MAG: hypothetical protein QOH39_1827 [Verrucomicrobiota bacterium]|jgi:hypothetical protein